MKYHVEITETLQETILIEASSELEARATAIRMYRSGAVALDSGNLMTTEIEVLEDDNNVKINP